MKSELTIENKRSLTRQSNIELLRIIAMILIVAHHFAVHGGFDFSSSTLSLNRFWIQFIQLGGKIGVDIFVLISGYFLISATQIKTKKVLIFWLQVFTYSVVLFVLFVVTKVCPFDFKTMIHCIFPITFSNWWFASTYFILYLICPFFNKLLNSFDKKQYGVFLVFFCIIWCLIPTFTTSSFHSNDLLWFMFLYALAGYIKLYDPLKNIKTRTWLILSVLIALLTFLSAVIFDILGTKMTVFSSHATYFYDMQKLPVFLISLFIFIGFLKLQIKPNRIINTVSSASFGVYLIHDHVLVRPFIWNTVFENAKYSESNYLIPYSLGIIVLVFVACTVIELLRLYILEKSYLKLLDLISNRIDSIKEKILSSSIFEKI